MKMSKDNSLNLNDESFHEKSKRIILLPYNYVARSVGKNFRTKLLYAFNKWFNASEEELNLVTEIIEMLHNGSMLHDDIEDNSITRRGLPTAHLIFGIPLCINAGTYVLMNALNIINKRFPADKVVAANKLFIDQVLEGHIGQGLEIYWRDNGKCPTESEYLYMVERKTGGLFAIGVKLLQLFSENKSDFMPFVYVLSQYFQIRDDYANLKLDDYTKSKGFAEDITEGKFSFPIIHAITNNPEDEEILNILKQRTTEVELKKYIISLLNKFGSFEYTCDTISKLDIECRKLVENMGNNTVMLSVLDILKLENIDNI